MFLQGKPNERGREHRIGRSNLELVGDNNDDGSGEKSIILFFALFHLFHTRKKNASPCVSTSNNQEKRPRKKTVSFWVFLPSHEDE